MGPGELSACISLHRYPTHRSQLTREPCSFNLGGEGLRGHESKAANNTAGEENDRSDGGEKDEKFGVQQRSTIVCEARQPRGSDAR